MLTKTLITAVIMIAALLSASSGSASRGLQQDSQALTQVSFSEDYQAVPDQQEIRQEFHQTYPFSPTGRVNVENLNGEVRIAVWDRNEVQVNAVKRAYKQERIDEAKIEVNAGAEAIRIRTDYPNWDQHFTDDERRRANNPAIVDYSIIVPRKARLESIDLVNGSLEINGVEGDVKASSVNGRVVARGLLGIAKLSTVNGGLEATFANLDSARPVSLNSVNGPVTLIIPSDANATVRAATVHGAISNDFGIQVHHGDYVGHELYGQIGQGGPTIKLGNVNGPIKIKHAQDGRAISPSTGLIPDKDKGKDKKGYSESDTEDEHDRLSAEERREAAAARRAERAEQASAERMSRETQAEVQREVERAIREAQREIERAQREVERETRQQIRNETREGREGRGSGSGSGRGEGRGAGSGSGRGEGYGKEFIEKESKTFTVSGTPSVNLSTFDGSITIRGWDKSEVMYTATKKANDPEEAKQIRIDSQQHGSSISVVARSYEDNGVASLEVYVPRNASLHVSSGDGSLNLDGVSGDLDLRTGDGSIEVNNARGQLRANTGDGSIKISDFDGNVDARTGDGSIALDGKFTALAARTGDGSISLAVPANSDFTIETDAEDVDNSGLTVVEDIATSKRMRRWKVGRGGNVFVLSTGDGRVALRPR